jgi:hypothetical protein
VSVSSRAVSGWGSAITIGALSSWIVGTAVMVTAMLVDAVLASGALEHLVFVVVLVPIVGALLFPGALVLGAAAGCLARGTARSMSGRAHAGSFVALGALIGVVYAAVLLRSVEGLEVARPVVLLAEAGLAGAVVGALLSTLVRRQVEV